EGKLSDQVEVRIGHATHITPEQCARLARLGIVVEANISSNLATGSLAMPSRLPKAFDPSKPVSAAAEPPNGVGRHPMLSMVAAGMPVVLATDGHGMVNTSLNAEFLRARRVVG